MGVDMHGKIAAASAAIFVIDELVAKPGQGQTLFEAYMTRYVPGAEARGMVLLHRMVEPGFWLLDRSNRLLFIWTLKDAGAVWAKNFVSREDPAVAEWWWKEAARLIESRRRSTLSEPAEIERLCDV